MRPGCATVTTVMSVVERLDLASRHWSAPVRWGYRSLKWSLVALGAFVWVGVLLQRMGILGH